MDINPGVPISFNERRQVLVADAQERSILRMKDGRLAPIDGAIGIPDADLLARITRIIGDC